MVKVNCLGCGNKILRKTAKKYQGYSRQCLAKRKVSNKPVLSSNKKKALENLAKLIQAGRLHTKSQFSYVWSIKNKKEQDYYYARYIANFAMPLVTGIEA